MKFITYTSEKPKHQSFSEIMVNICFFDAIELCKLGHFNYISFLDLR